MSVFTEHVVPSFGNLLALLMLLSPFPAVLRVRKAGKLGDINALPYPMTCFNAAGWVAYGFAVGNPYIFPANVVGFLAGMFFSLTAYGAAPRKVQDRIAAVFIVASGHLILLGLIGCFGLSKEAATRMWGTSAVVILMGYYVVPLSTMVDIVRTRNAVSIYPPLAVTAIANGTLWSIYGFAIADINLWLPNVFGTFIGAVQLLLRLKYGARVVSSGGAGSSSDVHGLDAVVLGKGLSAPPAEGRTDSSRNLLEAGSSSPLAPNGRPLPPPYDGTYGRVNAEGSGDLELAAAAAMGTAAAGASRMQSRPSI